MIAAFGRQFARIGRIPHDLHRALVQAQEVRLGADDLVGRSVPGEEAVEQIRRAEHFLAVTEELLGGPSLEDE